MLLSQLGSHKGSFFLLTSNPSGEVLLFEADPSRKREVAAFPIGSSIQFDPRPNCKDLLVLDQDGTFSLYTYDATSSSGSLELLSVGRLPLPRLIDLEEQDLATRITGQEKEATLMATKL